MAARDVAAVEAAREQVRRDAAGKIAEAEKRARTEEVEEDAHETAATAKQERASTLAAEDVAHIAEGPVGSGRAHGRPKAAESVVQDVAGAPEQVLGEAGQEKPRQVVATPEDGARDNSVEALPLHKWVKAATQSDDADAATDWTRDLLRKPGKTEADG